MHLILETHEAWRRLVHEAVPKKELSVPNLKDLVAVQDDGDFFKSHSLSSYSSSKPAAEALPEEGTGEEGVFGPASGQGPIEF